MLFERHFSRSKDFFFPSQIMVYGSKVAITSFKQDLSTVIDNVEISQTFRQLFNLHWRYTEEEHKQIVAGLKIKTK